MVSPVSEVSIETTPGAPKIPPVVDPRGIAVGVVPGDGEWWRSEPRDGAQRGVDVRLVDPQAGPSRTYGSA